MMPKRAAYQENRKYKHVQLKALICNIENDLSDLVGNSLSTDLHKKRMKDVQEMFFEIALRLD